MQIPQGPVGVRDCKFCIIEMAVDGSGNLPTPIPVLALQIQGEKQGAARAAASVQYRGVLGTILTMVRTEGPRSLYNGLVAGLQRQMSFASIRIGLYDSVKQFYTPKGADSECPVSHRHWRVGGSRTGVCGSRKQGSSDSEAGLGAGELITDTHEETWSPSKKAPEPDPAEEAGVRQGRPCREQHQAQRGVRWQDTGLLSPQIPASPPGFWRAAPQGPWQ